MKAALSKLQQFFDWPLFIALLLLVIIGAVNLHSATSSTELGLLRRHAYLLGAGLVVFFLSAVIDYRILYRLAYPLYGVGLALLALVLVVGKSVNKAQRWIELGFFTMQPSELMKVLLIIGLAKFLHDDPVVEGRQLKHMAIPFLLVALPVMLVLRQPDLGTAMLIFLLFLSVMLLTKLKLRSILTLFVVATGALPLTWTYLLKDYQKQRVFTFLDPSSDPTGAGWQARQSLYAIGSGGFSGKGYMKGTQNQLHFLPERWTDFPFSVWAEEWGFVGGAFLLGIYFFIIMWAMKLASQARDRFGAVLCVGVASLYFWHTVISISMVTGMAPVVGMTLPLVSYGGSSLLTTMIASGLLMNVSIRKSSF
ncbi:MAG: rod shape-determining protein RodA [Deltaproteobacteria bacterium]|nr:rod shape-determining protein RodA [Deltaproteobacteria bacterium]